MGLLTIATPMTWADAQPHTNQVRAAGVEQFISILQDPRPLPTELLFGDEVEYMIVSFDEASSSVAPALRANEVLDELNQTPSDSSQLHPEYANYMIEATPAEPFRGIGGLAEVESSMRTRRARIATALRPDERLLTLTAFPTLGATTPQPAASGGGEFGRSAYLPDEITFPHPRFLTMTRNIRERRGELVNITAPVMQDSQTSLQSVHMDHQAFGMGMSCLQVTLQMPSLKAARRVHDQMASVAPVLLALTAATPILKGMLVDTDARWNYIGQSVDDRTAAERGVSIASTQPDSRMAGGGVTLQHKPRYSTIQGYISEADGSANDPTVLNDIPMVLDPEVLTRLLEAGVDSTLAQHVAMLFSRDPLVLFEEHLESSVGSNEHFENLNSMTWQTVRLKPPPPQQSKIGWRVEVRPYEINLTDFENAAWTAFAVLLANAAVSDSAPDWRVPISSLDANMTIAHQREAVVEAQMAWNVEGKLANATVNEIVNGKGGLLSVARQELARAGLRAAEVAQLERYLMWVGNIAAAQVDTTATWIRQMVTQHPKYRHDSVVSEEIAADLLKACEGVTKAGPRARVTSLAWKVQDGKVKRNAPKRCRGDNVKQPTLVKQIDATVLAECDTADQHTVAQNTTITAFDRLVETTCC